MAFKPPELSEDNLMDSVFHDLRRALVLGQVSESEAMGELIAGYLAEHGGDEVLRFQESMRWMLDGINAILAGDNRTGIACLENLTNRDSSNISLSWAAWIWTAWAGRGAGDLEAAREAARTAHDLSSHLDARARSTSLCALGESETVTGEVEQALKHLVQAEELFKELSDQRGMAMAMLSQARLMAVEGWELDSVFSAQEARSLDPTWAEPILFLVQHAFSEGNLDQVEELLDELEALQPRPPEAERERRLLALVREGRVPLWVVNEYVRLRGDVPSEEAVGELEVLMGYSPQFTHLEEELAWKLLKLGKYDEAAAHFDTLAERELDPDLRSSVLLGLGCLASVRQRHRQPGARVRAVVSAVPASMKREVSQTRPLPSQQGLAPEPAQAAAQAAAQAQPKARPQQEVLAQEQEGRPGRITDKGTAIPIMPGRSMSAQARGVDLQWELEAITGKKAVFSGDLQVLALPDLLSYLRNSRRTGTLVLSSGNGIGAIYLQRGMITGAASPNCANIGHLLLTRGALTEDQLETARRAQEADNPDRLLGAIIVEQGLVQHEVMRKALTDQAYTAIRELFHWTDGQFAFSPDTTGFELPSEVEVELDPQAVLLEVARLIDEEKRDEQGSKMA